MFVSGREENRVKDRGMVVIVAVERARWGVWGRVEQRCDEPNKEFDTFVTINKNTDTGGPRSRGGEAYGSLMHGKRSCLI